MSCSCPASRTRSPTAMSTSCATPSRTPPSSGSTDRTCSGGAPARSAPWIGSGSEGERLAELLEGVDVERRPQREVDLIGAGRHVLADAVDDLLHRATEHAGADVRGEGAEL